MEFNFLYCDLIILVKMSVFNVAGYFVEGDLTGFNRIAIHFPCVGSWMAPGQGSLWLI